MPNWNYNEVVIKAPRSEVMPYFIKEDKQYGDGYMLNMHILFPDKFPESDPYGVDNWSYDWFVDNTGTKWNPIVTFSNIENETHLDYDSAWVPNNLALLKLSEITGWRIENNYEENGQWIEGYFVCANGIVEKDDIADYRPTCELCDKKFDECDTDIDDECGYGYCPKCKISSDKGGF